MVEAMMIALLTTTMMFMLVYFVTSCEQTTSLDGLETLEINPVKLYCTDQTFNEMATLVMQSPEKAMRTVIHVPLGFYSITSLITFIVVYFVLCLLTYGINVPSGIFVPQCLIGACWGRMLAVLLDVAIGREAHNTQVATFAILGAAAQLAGVVRITISLVVILMETVQSLKLALPLMLTVWVAKYIGDLFGHGLYDQTIMMNEVPLLNWEPPNQASTVPARFGPEIDNMRNETKFHVVMSSKVRVLRLREKVAKVFQMLLSSKHHAFPIVSEFTHEDEDGYFDVDDNWVGPQHYGRLEGMITREQLIVLLAERAFDYTDSLTPCPITLAAFRNAFPKYDMWLKNVRLSEEDMGKTLDMTLYMDRAPYTATTGSSLRKLHALFRQLGLRHVIITNKQHQVVGVVTRKDVIRFAEVRLPNKQTTIKEMPINYTDT